MKIRDLDCLQINTHDKGENFYSGHIVVGDRVVGLITRVYKHNEQGIKGYKARVINPTKPNMELGEFKTTEEATTSILNRDADEVEHMTEFVEYWIEKDDEDIVSMLYDIMDHRLNTVIDVEESVMDLGDNMYKVSCVVFRENKGRKDLLNLIKKYDDA